ncbi:chemotaxis protein CheA, partial [Clostridia bacterium OttesenSCG-928-F22]|nr:chemotaxis protein CheA [Clostridia bacterium OttesenSCG-928-F22]
SSAMMNYDNLAKLSHAMEDLFGFIRDNIGVHAYDHNLVCDLVFSAEDVLRSEIENLQDGLPMEADPTELIEQIHAYYEKLKSQASGGEAPTAEAAAPVSEQPASSANPAAAATPTGQEKYYKAVVFFEKECKMENIRAFGILNSIEELCVRVSTIPEDVLKDHSDDEIVQNGFTIFMQSSAPMEDLKNRIAGNLFIDKLTIEEISDLAGTPLDRRTKPQEAAPARQADAAAAQQAQKYNYMSVRLDKLDKLMNLVGEIVIAETTVSKNPDLAGLQLESFSKAALQMRKLTDELQDTVMSIRMIPISATFHKLERIVRDMCKKTKKEADLVIIGEDTEMDKNVIDNLSDPLMHIIRNAMDHGIEMPDVREKAGKNRTGKVILEARNTGGDVMITVTDDGKGLNRDVLVQKGIDRGIIKKPPEEVSDKEAYNLIFAAGFSTKDTVSEFSGRGVGMDVAIKNIQKMGGSISVDSELGQGMTVQLRIPLTLAIIDGMEVSVGKSIFIIPLLNIRESFKPKAGDVFEDPDGNEMILIRDECYSVVRLHKLLGIETAITNFEDGILILIESDRDAYCLFVDHILGEQQTVIKPIPPYIARAKDWIKGIGGCTIMGDGSISLILDINSLFER